MKTTKAKLEAENVELQQETSRLAAEVRSMREIKKQMEDRMSEMEARGKSLRASIDEAVVLINGYRVTKFPDARERCANCGKPQSDTTDTRTDEQRFLAHLVNGLNRALNPPHKYASTDIRSICNGSEYSY